MKTSEPKSIKEAIDDLHIFLDCDLYSKFRPKIKLPNRRYVFRKDFFDNEEQFSKYLEEHFKVLREQIIKLVGKKFYEK